MSAARAEAVYATIADLRNHLGYTGTIERVNDVPHRLEPVMRSAFRVYVNRGDREQLANLTRLAEERAAT